MKMVGADTLHFQLKSWNAFVRESAVSVRVLGAPFPFLVLSRVPQRLAAGRPPVLASDWPAMRLVGIVYL